MASVEVLSATIAHAEEANHEPENKPEETKKDDVANPPPPPPPPPPPSEQKQTDPKTEHGADVALEPETLAVALEAKANLADKPVVPEKKVVGSLSKVAPEPVEDRKVEENGEVVLEPDDVQDVEDEKEKPVEEEEKGSPQAKIEKKED